MASGTSASTLHYDNNDQPLNGRQLVVLDAGAEWNCYASDITRTFPISGKFSLEAADIYRVVQRMQAECIQRVRPGVLFSGLHLHACIVAIHELLKLGILHNGTASEILKRGTVAAFFPHGLGHHVGLEVHDVTGGERLLLASSPLAPSQSLPGVVEWFRRGSARTAAKREWVGPEMLKMMFQETCAQLSAGVPVVETSDLPPAARSVGTQVLAKNMVVTIEPGM